MHHVEGDKSGCRIRGQLLRDYPPFQKLAKPAG